MKELAAKLRMSPKATQRVYRKEEIPGKKRETRGTSETRESLFRLSCWPDRKPIRGTKETRWTSETHALPWWAKLIRILRVGDSADESGRFQSQGLRRNGGTLWRGSTPNQDIGAEVGPILPNNCP